MGVQPAGEGLVEFRVTDDGEGIPADQQARIFDPYFSTRAEGMGMGLAICRSIIEAHQASLTVESELRLWVPIGGTDFAGEVLRYGVGLSYGLWQTCSFQIRPVAEVVGWTVLSGKESSAQLIQDAAGDTIVNAKLGMRMGYSDVSDFYVGYGRPLTGEVWYKDIVRMEWRLRF